MLEHAFQDSASPPLPSNFSMLVWKIQMKSHVDCVYQNCKEKGAGRVSGVSMTFVNDCSFVLGDR